MKPVHLLPFIILFGSHFSPLVAQTPTLEFATGQGPTGSGPTVADQVVTFQNNPNNPTDNVFAAYAPTTTVTYSLSNQQYGAGTTNPGVTFGGTTSTTAASVPDPSVLFQAMGAAALSQYYTSAATITAGTGISAPDNYALQILLNANYNNPVAANTSYQYADLTLTFSRPLVSPILQVVGLGARSGSVSATAIGYTTELTLLTPGVTLSLLSGSQEMQVMNSQVIRNKATAFSTTTNAGAASGSVLVTTPSGGVTSLQLRLNLRIGANSGAPTQSGGAGGDGFLLGVSQLTPTPLPVKLVSFTAQAVGQQALLRWATASELQNDYFAIERSLNGSSFQAIGQVRGQGAGGSGASYSFADAGLGQQALAYYRLRQVDVDGTSSYSPVLILGAAAPAPSISLSPNPATSALVLDLTQLPAKTYQVRVLDATGRVVLRQELMGGLAHSLAVAPLPGGVYSVVVPTESRPLIARLCKE